MKISIRCLRRDCKLILQRFDRNKNTSYSKFQSFKRNITAQIKFYFSEPFHNQAKLFIREVLSKGNKNYQNWMIGIVKTDIKWT